MEWLSDNVWLGWIGLALLLAAIEAATVDFVFLMFAGGALAGAAAAAAGAGTTLQIVIAILVAILLLGVVRPIVRRHFIDGALDHGIGAGSLIGRDARVLETVTDRGGLVKLGGEEWSARAAQAGVVCEPGSDVQVVAIDGATALVVPSAPIRHLGSEPSTPPVKE